MRTFGLIGYPLSHSFSKKFFSEKFQREGIENCVYENFSIPTIEDFPNIAANYSLEGLNVTIPYKQQIIPYLDYTTEVVAKIGACNCIRFTKGKLLGYNTDTTGFEQSLKRQLLPHHNKALILGTGGAAKAIRYVLQKLGIEYVSVTSSANGNGKDLLSYNLLTDEMLLSHTLVINTTPLGMYPKVGDAPPINYDLLTPAHYLFDAIYNPELTLFLERGKKKGAIIQNGFDMLIAQAEESWRIWNEPVA